MAKQKNRPAGAGDLAPETLLATPGLAPDALRRMTWLELAEWSAVLDTLREWLQGEMDERAPHVAHIESLRGDDLEAYVRHRKPEWEYARSKLEGTRGTGGEPAEPGAAPDRGGMS